MALFIDDEFILLYFGKSAGDEVVLCCILIVLIKVNLLVQISFTVCKEHLHSSFPSGIRIQTVLPLLLDRHLVYGEFQVLHLWKVQFLGVAGNTDSIAGLDRRLISRIGVRLIGLQRVCITFVERCSASRLTASLAA